MTPVTGATFPTAIRRLAPCSGGERRRRTPVLVSADAGRACLLLWRPVRWRCRKHGGLLGSRAPGHRLMAVGAGPKRSGSLVKRVDRQPQAHSRRSRALIRPGGGRELDSPPARSPASKAPSRRSRALIRPRAGRELDSHSIAMQRRECCSKEENCLVGFRRPRWLRAWAGCEGPDRSAARVRFSPSAAGDLSVRSLASARSRLAPGGPAPSAFSHSAAGDRKCPPEESERVAAGAAAERSLSEFGRSPGNFRLGSVETGPAD
jgi:hypothetical protein